MSTALHEIRHAFRQLRTRPACAVAVAILALGIGANTAILSALRDE